jgi:hypothetical protein
MTITNEGKMEYTLTVPKDKLYWIAYCLIEKAGDTTTNEYGWLQDRLQPSQAKSLVNAVNAYGFHNLPGKFREELLTHIAVCYRSQNGECPSTPRGKLWERVSDLVLGKGLWWAIKDKRLDDLPIGFITVLIAHLNPFDTV